MSKVVGNQNSNCATIEEVETMISETGEEDEVIAESVDERDDVAEEEDEREGAPEDEAPGDEALEDEAPEDEAPGEDDDGRDDGPDDASERTHESHEFVPFRADGLTYHEARMAGLIVEAAPPKPKSGIKAKVESLRNSLAGTTKKKSSTKTAEEDDKKRMSSSLVRSLDKGKEDDKEVEHAEEEADDKDVEHAEEEADNKDSEDVEQTDVPNQEEGKKKKKKFQWSQLLF